MYRYYRDFIENHPSLKGKIKEEKDVYLPCYRLALRIKEKVEDEISKQINSGKDRKFSTDLREYIPLEKGREVDKVVTGNLKQLIEHTPLPGSDEKIRFNLQSTDKLIQKFWYQVRNYSYPGEKKINEYCSVSFLDILCRFIGEAGFESFIENEFSQETGLRVLVLPFWRQYFSDGIRMEKMLEHALQEMQYDSNITIESLEPEALPGADGRLLTKKEVRNIANDRLADVVFWCSIYEEDTGVFYSLIVHPILGYYEDYWSMSFDLHEFKHPKSLVRKKILATVYWCLAIQDFLHSKYTLCLTNFKNILELEIDEIEVLFRMGVVLDLIDNHEFSRGKYLTMLDLAGVKDAARAVRSIYGFPYEYSTPLKEGATIEVSGDYIQKNAVKLGEGSHVGFNKLMYFEIVRIKLALSLKEELPVSVFERALDKAIRYTDPTLLETKYFPILGEAYFELALIIHNKIGKDHLMSLEEILYYYEKAALYSKNLEVHQACIHFFKKCGCYQKMAAKMKEKHSESEKLIAIYATLSN